MPVRNKNFPEFRSRDEQEKMFKLLTDDFPTKPKDTFSIVRPILGLGPVLEDVPQLKVAPQVITFATGLKQAEAHGIILSAFGSNGRLMALLNADTETNSDNATARNSITLQREVLAEPIDDGNRLFIPVNTLIMTQLVQEKHALDKHTKNTVPNHLFPDCAIDLGVLGEDSQLEVTKVYLKENLPEIIAIGAVAVTGNM